MSAAGRACIVLLLVNPWAANLALWLLQCCAEADLAERESTAMGKGDGLKLKAVRERSEDFLQPS